jgi:muramidase (phage lysozyme)
MGTVISAQEAGGENLPLFLGLIGFSEGTATSPATQNDGYDVIVTGHDGKLNIFTDYATHPFDRGRQPIVLRVEDHGTPALASTASGRYQIMLRTWRAYHYRLALTDFRPFAQDQIAIELIRERGAIPHLVAGDIATAIGLCANIWASFPGNSYGQAGGKKIDELLEQFDRLKGGGVASRSA